MSHCNLCWCDLLGDRAVVHQVAGCNHMCVCFASCFPEPQHVAPAVPLTTAPRFNHPPTSWFQILPGSRHFAGRKWRKLSHMLQAGVEEALRGHPSGA